MEGSGAIPTALRCLALLCLTHRWVGVCCVGVVGLGVRKGRGRKRGEEGNQRQWSEASLFFAKNEISGPQGCRSPCCLLHLHYTACFCVLTLFTSYYSKKHSIIPSSFTTHSQSRLFVLFVSFSSSLPATPAHHHQHHAHHLAGLGHLELLGRQCPGLFAARARCRPEVRLSLFCFWREGVCFVCLVACPRVPSLLHPP